LKRTLFFLLLAIFSPSTRAVFYSNLDLSTSPFLVFSLVKSSSISSINCSFVFLIKPEVVTL
jgi:hypothetical protein